MPRSAAGPARFSHRGRQKLVIRRAFGHIVQNLHGVRHGVVVDGDGVVVAALERPHLRPAAVGVLGIEQVLHAALDGGAESAPRPHRDAPPGAPWRPAPGSGSASTSNRCRAWRCSASWDPPACRNRPGPESGSRCRRRRGRPARAALNHVDVLAPPAVRHLPGDHVARILERFVARPPLRRMVAAQRKHAAPARGMLGTGIPRSFLLVGQRLLVDGLLFLRAI